MLGVCIGGHYGTTAVNIVREHFVVRHPSEEDASYVGPSYDATFGTAGTIKNGR